MEIGSRLMELRKEKGYTREEFAIFLGISKYTLRNYELGKTDPGHTFLKRMSDFFNVSMDFLVGLTDEREKMQSHKLKSSEYNMLEKYRFISTHSPDGVSVIDTVLDRECAIAEKLKENEKRIAELKENITAQGGKKLDYTPKKSKNEDTEMSEELRTPIDPEEIKDARKYLKQVNFAAFGGINSLSDEGVMEITKILKNENDNWGGISQCRTKKLEEENILKIKPKKY